MKVDSLNPWCVSSVKSPLTCFPSPRLFTGRGNSALLIKLFRTGDGYLLACDGGEFVPTFHSSFLPISYKWKEGT